MLRLNFATDQATLVTALAERTTKLLKTAVEVVGTKEIRNSKDTLLFMVLAQSSIRGVGNSSTLHR